MDFRLRFVYILAVFIVSMMVNYIYITSYLPVTSEEKYENVSKNGKLLKPFLGPTFVQNLVS